MSKRSFIDSSDNAESTIQSKKLRTDDLSRERSESAGSLKNAVTATTPSPEILGLSDILFVEHAVSNLQTAIRDVIAKAPTQQALKQLEETSADIESSEVLLALKRSKLLLASKLRSLYDDGKLPLLDQIINFEDSIDYSPANDVRLVLDEKSIKEAKEQEEPRRALDYFPPIPTLKNPAIRAQVFLHKSLAKDKLFLSKKEVINTHNERLEFIGDSVLNNIMTLIVYNKYPFASEGELSQLRTRLINNVTLQKWSFKYGLDKQLKQNIDDSVSKGKLKIYADVFEAYIGGLITESSDNYPIVYNWLKELAELVLQEKGDQVIERMNHAHPTNQINNNAKVELYSLIGYASLGLHYKTTERHQTKDITKFVVQVRTKSDDVLGTGTGKNTKEAGARAAMDALANKAVIEKYSKLRAAIPRDASTKPVGFDPKRDEDFNRNGNRSASAPKQGPDSDRF